MQFSIKSEGTDKNKTTYDNKTEGQVLRYTFIMQKNFFSVIAGIVVSLTLISGPLMRIDAAPQGRLYFVPRGLDDLTDFR